MAVAQLTVRGLEPELARRLRETARAKDISLNEAALDLMRRGAGIPAEELRGRTIGDGLDAFIGSWSEADEKGVLDAIRVFGVADEEQWGWRRCRIRRQTGLPAGHSPTREAACGSREYAAPCPPVPGWLPAAKGT